MEVSLHPHRYPKHKDEKKGQVYGGECNVTACDRLDAIYWNSETYGLYCETCAVEINWLFELCELVKEKPAL